MKRIIPIVIILIALIVAVVGISKPWIGGVIETWETQHGSVKVRVENRAENIAWLPGAYYVFQSSLPGSNSWREIMTFRHDDPGRIPRENVRFVNEQLGYVFMGWMFAVTTDGGSTWSVWDAEKDLPNWDCCNYGLIKDVRIEADGRGVMILDSSPQRRGEVPELRTNDFGQHWSQYAGAKI
ncbi:MAG TPA: hypothetical protein VK363_11345 [Pyrinomonadaceae bacterium]|nr:hypothetical protein [Pyrinomonadaceae bacterium]